MNDVAGGQPAETPRAAAPTPDRCHPTYNFFALAAHQVLLRIGWIFKTESIIVPAFLDAIGGSAVLRGFLPMLHRFGASIPPVLFARRLKLTRQKKWALAVCCACMGVPFLLLSWLWVTGQHSGGGRNHYVTPSLFLVLYGVFFAFVGISRLAMDTLQGKLIRANYRGRLFTLSTVVGAPLAIAAAYWKLGTWLSMPDGFARIFGFCGTMFVVAAGIVLFLREEADDYRDNNARITDHFKNAWHILVTDRDFRALAIVAALYGIVLMMMPHLQALGRERLDLAHPDLLWWVVIQHASMAFFSLFAGPLADRSGNRAALHYTVLGSALPPLVALGLTTLGPVVGGRFFWLVYVPVGLTAVTFRLVTNFALELAPPAEHPRYLSTIGLCFAAPVMLGAVPLGWLIDRIGFEPVLICGSAVVILAWLLTFRLAEPRHLRLPATSDDDSAIV